MIAMTCPSCGRRGKAPSDRVNVRMHCPKCDAVFHIDKQGKVKLGDPRVGVEEGQGGRRGERESRRHSDEPYATSLTQLVVKSPWWVKLVLVGLVVVAAWPWLRSWFEGKPASLEAMARRVAYAFGEKRFEDLRRMAAPGTEEALRTWYEELRGAFEFEPEAGQEAGTGLLFGASSPVAMDREGNRVSLMIDVGVSRAGAPVPAEVLAEQKRSKAQRRPDWAPGYKFHGSFTLPTVWVRDTKGRWWLDGEDTLNLTKQHSASRR